MKEIISAVARVNEFRLHPLGFFYLLDKQEYDITHRIHVWPTEGIDQSRNDRHQHSFDIDSTVYAGCIRSEIFRFRVVRHGDDHEFRVTYEHGKSVLSATGRQGTLESICMFESSAGNSYFLRSGIIHSVAVLERPCVTLVRTREKGATIFSYGNDIEESSFERRFVNKSESTNIVRILESVASESK